MVITSAIFIISVFCLQNLDFHAKKYGNPTNVRLKGPETRPEIKKKVTVGEEGCCLLSLTRGEGSILLT